MQRSRATRVAPKSAFRSVCAPLFVRLLGFLYPNCVQSISVHAVLRLFTLSPITAMCHCQRRYLLCDNSTNNPLTIVFSGDRRQLHHIITGTHTHALARTPQINTKQQKPLLRLLHTAHKHTATINNSITRAEDVLANILTSIDFVRPSGTHTYAHSPNLAQTSNQ